MLPGFKLDTLLKLADVKGTDRRTSLLHFVVRQLIASQPSVEQLSQQLAASKQAADIQVRNRNKASSYEKSILAKM